MKRIMVLVMLLCLLPLSALAEMDADGDVVVSLEGAEFFFTPIVGYCVTRASNAAVFSRLGMSRTELVPWMEANDVYALMYDEAITTEVGIIAYAIEGGSFDDMNAFGETMLCEGATYFFTDQGFDVESADIYLAPEGHRFVRLVLSRTDETGAAAQWVYYMTSQAGYTVSISGFPLRGTLTEDQAALCEGIADSLWIMETN